MIYERRGRAGPRMSGGEVDGSWSLCVVTDRRAQRNTPVGQEGSVICSQMRLGLGDPQCPVGRDGAGEGAPSGGVQEHGLDLPFPEASARRCARGHFSTCGVGGNAHPGPPTRNTWSESDTHPVRPPVGTLRERRMGVPASRGRGPGRALCPSAWFELRVVTRSQAEARVSAMP